MVRWGIRFFWLGVMSRIVLLWNPGIVYGISPGENISFLELGQWMLVLLPVLLSSGSVFLEQWGIRFLTAQRYGSNRKWWNQIWLKIFAIQLFYSVMLGTITWENGGREGYLWILQLFLHLQLLFWSAVFLYLKGVELSMAVAALLLFEMFTLMVPLRGIWTVGAWGMYHFSQMMLGEGGSRITIAIQLMVLFPVWLWFGKNRREL